MRMIGCNSTPRHVVALSGGKDSVAMALRLHELNPNVDYDYVYTPTGDELPEMEQHMAYVESLLEKPLTRLYEVSLLDLIREQKMIPNFRARFCTRMLKIDPFYDYMREQPPGSVWYVGLRADEYDRDGVQPAAVDHFEIVHPLQEWGWGLAEVLDYLECRGVTIPARTDCGACFYQRIGEWADLLKNHPDRYQQYVDVEVEMGHTFRSPGRDTWPASLAELRDEIQGGRPVPRRKGKRGPAACPWCSR